MATANSSVQDALQHQQHARGQQSPIRAFFGDFLRVILDPYHPEAHYMRGPGPACAAKKKSLRPPSK